MVSDEIIKVLDNLAQKFGIVIDWTSDNVIPYLQNLLDKYISYDMFKNILIMSILFILTIIFSILTYKWLKKWKKEEQKDIYDQNESIMYIFIIFAMISGALLFVDLVLFPFLLDYLIQDIYIPELRILDLIHGGA